jgi:hypothetical protein
VLCERKSWDRDLALRLPRYAVVGTKEAPDGYYSRMLIDHVKRGRASMREQRFRDRTEAGQLLASRLTAYANRPDVLVLALPRGGVPVAYEVARALHAPLDVIIVRKLGVPGVGLMRSKKTKGRRQSPSSLVG